MAATKSLADLILAEARDQLLLKYPDVTPAEADEILAEYKLDTEKKVAQMMGGVREHLVAYARRLGARLESRRQVSRRPTGRGSVRRRATRSRRVRVRGPDREDGESAPPGGLPRPLCGLARYSGAGVVA